MRQLIVIENEIKSVKDVQETLFLTNQKLIFFQGAKQIIFSKKYM
jgi:hypothetical protein